MVTLSPIINVSPTRRVKISMVSLSFESLPLLKPLTCRLPWSYAIPREGGIIENSSRIPKH